MRGLSLIVLTINQSMAFVAYIIPMYEFVYNVVLDTVAVLSQGVIGHASALVSVRIQPTYRSG